MSSTLAPPPPLSAGGIERSQDGLPKMMLEKTGKPGRNGLLSPSPSPVLVATAGSSHVSPSFLPESSLQAAEPSGYEDLERRSGQVQYFAGGVGVSGGEGRRISIHELLPNLVNTSPPTTLSDSTQGPSIRSDATSSATGSSLNHQQSTGLAPFHDPSIISIGAIMPSPPHDSNLPPRNEYSSSSSNNEITYDDNDGDNHQHQQYGVDQEGGHYEENENAFYGDYPIYDDDQRSYVPYTDGQVNKEAFPYPFPPFPHMYHQPPLPTPVMLHQEFPPMQPPLVDAIHPIPPPHPAAYYHPMHPMPPPLPPPHPAAATYLEEEDMQGIPLPPIPMPIPMPMPAPHQFEHTYPYPFYPPYEENNMKAFAPSVIPHRPNRAPVTLKDPKTGDVRMVFHGSNNTMSSSSSF
ncbi:hypothetical protein HDV05_007129 [Chytridiales sp. JEL 0842]|nr:hypothetical protein HDV05_007129 [Chytridiales sp. JEL 0842]